MPGVAGNRTSHPLITSPTPNQLSYFVPIVLSGGQDLTSLHYKCKCFHQKISLEFNLNVLLCDKIWCRYLAFARNYVWYYRVTQTLLWPIYAQRYLWKWSSGPVITWNMTNQKCFTKSLKQCCWQCFLKYSSFRYFADCASAWTISPKLSTCVGLCGH